jgi:hypothetical protein
MKRNRLSEEQIIGRLHEAGVWDHPFDLNAFGARVRRVQVEDSTLSIRLLLQQALGAEPQVLHVAADEDATERYPKDAGGRPGSNRPDCPVRTVTEGNRFFWMSENGRWRRPFLEASSLRPERGLASDG